MDGWEFFEILKYLNIPENIERPRTHGYKSDDSVNQKIEISHQLDISKKRILGRYST